VHVRSRRWVVDEVTDKDGGSPIVSLACAEDDAQHSCASVLAFCKHWRIYSYATFPTMCNQQRAKREGRSLQQYVARELTRIVQRPSLSEVLDRIDRRTGGEVGLARAADDLTEERSRVCRVK